MPKEEGETAAINFFAVQQSRVKLRIDRFKKSFAQQKTFFTATFNSSMDRSTAVDRQSRSRSPIARNKAVDEASDIYRQAMDKVYEASWKFDRGKNGDFLKVGWRTNVYS